MVSPVLSSLQFCLRVTIFGSTPLLLRVKNTGIFFSLLLSIMNLLYLPSLVQSMKHMCTSFPTSKALSHIVLRLKVPSLVPIFGLNLLCRMLTSWSILVATLTSIIFYQQFGSWLMSMVRYSKHFCTFDFFGIGIKIDCFIYPLVYSQCCRLYCTNL